MKVWPVLLDSTPEYLNDAIGGRTLLMTPIGRERLLDTLVHELDEVAADSPIIFATQGVTPAYHARITALAPAGTLVVDSARALSDALAPAETSDQLLFLDPRCLPFHGWSLPAFLFRLRGEPTIARYLVAHGDGLGGTREYVNVDEDGQVRGVRRYYKPATWPFLAGVAACLVPVSSAVLPLDAAPTSLVHLRERLVTRGVPSRDVVIAEGAFDLTREDGLLAAMERSVHDAVEGAAPPLLVGDGHVIDSSARLIGPVVVHAGARIEGRATVVGPSLIGPQAVVSAGAVLAHVVIGADAVVPAGRVLRDRAWFAPAGAGIEPAGPEARRATFPERLARHRIGELPAAVPPPLDVATSRAYPRMKRAFDVVVAAVALVLLSPLLALVAAIVRLDSRGPIFFRHVREGLNGRTFACLKFRTMRDGTNELQRRLKGQDKMDGPHFKMRADPRITRVGRWLRVTNLDELPQLLNVLVGHMSLVGPRPSPFRENQICVPWREGRLSVRPGITGLWQVCRHDRDAGDFHQWIEYDLLYVQHMSMALDFKVLTATFLTLGGKYPVRVDRFVPGAAEMVVTTDAGTYAAVDPSVARAADVPAPPAQ